MPIEATLGRLAIVTSQAINNQPSTTNYAYDPARPGLLTQVSGPAHNVYNTWEPDRDILKTKTNVHGSLVAGSVISAYDYTVNNVGQRTNVATSGSAFTGVAGWTWGYDALGQVTSATHATNSAFNQGYQYDDIGNRKQSGVGVPPVSGFTTTYTPNALNQYTTISSGNPQSAIQNPQYDDDGNQLSGSTGQALGQTFVWDGENRLSAVKDATGNVLVSYTYDHASRRIRRTDATGTKLYIYNGWNCVSEYTLGAPSVPAALSRVLTWGKDLSNTLQGAGGVGGLLSVQSLASSGLVSSVSYPTYDGNGSISEYLDAAGTLAAHFEYDAFGNVIASSGNIANFDYRFSTKPQDAVTGWYYYGYRWYDAVNGRWPGRDPLGERGGASLYAFLSNKPTAKVDLLGLADSPAPVGPFLDKVDPGRNKGDDPEKQDVIDKHACVGGVAAACNKYRQDPADGHYKPVLTDSDCYQNEAEARTAAQSKKCKCKKKAKVWVERSTGGSDPPPRPNRGGATPPASGYNQPGIDDFAFDSRLMGDYSPNYHQTSGVTPTGDMKPNGDIPSREVYEPLDDWRKNTPNLNQRELWCVTCPEK